MIGIALLIAGCGGGRNGSQSSPPVTTTTTPAARPVLVYFLRGGQVWPVRGHVADPKAVARATLEVLLDGPLDGERPDLGLRSAIPEGSKLEEVSTAGNATIVKLSRDLPAAALAQVVYTLTQFPTVTAVEYKGKRYTRADFEDLTPPILVEAPLSYQEVSSPIHVTGTANTYEATFDYELLGEDGKVLSKNYVTATSGSGTRGTFDFTVPYKLDQDAPGKLVVYEVSAENGKRIHTQEIPLQLRAS